MVNPFKPRGPYVGQVKSADQDQTVRNAHMSRVSTVYLQNALLNFEKKNTTKHLGSPY